MGAEHWARVKEVFSAALECDAAGRGSFVAEACAGDKELGAEVFRLLDQHAQGEGFLRTVGADAVFDIGGERSGGDGDVGGSRGVRGIRIGPYEVLDVLGEGGMGVVYLARREHPRRTVALKVIRPGVVSPSVLRRFEHEAQVLALLQHPGIAQIFEAGTAEVVGVDGTRGGGPQPFFAMELVRGCSLLEHVQKAGLSVRERLELFALVCDAVAHAHQKGIIHRDLKPANILVAEGTGDWAPGTGARAEGSGDRAPGTGDGGIRSPVPGAQCPVPLPKILDFGVARVTDADLQVTTMQTDAAQLIGTLAYMSPEQASGDPGGRGLDTRSDVYALGVILYELLTDRPPYDLRGKTIPEAARIIRETEPARPSTVRALLRGDVETIVAKALEKDKDRRYQSAAELAADIRRYLADEPIAARPASALYHLRTFARRNRALVWGVAAAGVLLVLGTVGTTWQAVAATRARDRARAAERLAEARLQEAVHSAVEMHELAEQRLANIPGATKAREQAARAAVRQASAAAATPPGSAAATYVLAYAHQRVGEVNLVEGHTAEALASFLASLQARRRLAEEDPGNPAAQRSLAVGFWRVADAQIQMGRLAEAQGNNRGAEAIHRSIAALGDEPPVDHGVYLGIARRRVADIQLLEADPAGAERAYRESLELFGSGLAVDPDNVQLLRGRAMALRGLGEALTALGRADEAVATLEESGRVIERLGLESGPANVWERTNQLRMLLAMTDARLAARNADAALEAARIGEGLSQADPDNAESRQLFARALAALGRSALNSRSAEATEEATKSCARAAEILGALARTDPDDARVARELAIAWLWEGRARRGSAGGDGPGTEGSPRGAEVLRRGRDALRQLKTRGVLAPVDEPVLDEIQAELRTAD
jgi:serine/threonine protein kinase